jgi:TPR repeat protein
MYYFLLLAFVLTIATGCRSKSDYYRIPRAEFEKVERAANDGDSKSALRLSNHWLIANGDLENGTKWMYRAAELGDQVACKNLPKMGIFDLPSGCNISVKH